MKKFNIFLLLSLFSTSLFCADKKRVKPSKELRKAALAAVSQDDKSNSASVTNVPGKDKSSAKYSTQPSQDSRIKTETNTPSPASVFQEETVATLKMQIESLTALKLEALRKKNKKEAKQYKAKITELEIKIEEQQRSNKQQKKQIAKQQTREEQEASHQMMDIFEMIKEAMDLHHTPDGDTKNKKTETLFKKEAQLRSLMSENDVNEAIITAENIKQMMMCNNITTPEAMIAELFIPNTTDKKPS